MKGKGMKYISVAVIWLAFISGVSSAAEKPVLKDTRDKESYSLGYQIGGAYKNKDVDINTDVFMIGLQDGLTGSEPQLSRQEMQTTLGELQKKARDAEAAKKKRPVEQYRGEGREFLAANAKEPGVVTLPSGLQYKVIREGSGKSPGPHDSVTVNYRGTLINGNEFDSSYRNGEPATFRVDGVIKGWTEALQMMKEGSKWELFVPSEVAYGARGMGRIPPNSTLIFDVELISVGSSR